MKKQLLSALFLASLSANGAITHLPEDTNLQLAVSSASCSIVVQKPILFLKGETEKLLDRDTYLKAHKEDFDNVRQLSVGRELVVYGFDGPNTIVFQDKSIHSLNNNFEHVQLRDRSISAIEWISSGSLKMICNDGDTPVEF